MIRIKDCRASSAYQWAAELVG